MTIAGLNCAELTALYRRGELLAGRGRARLPRPHRRHARFNAFMPIDAGACAGSGRRSEARWRQGRRWAPVDGVPATIKDNIWLKGYPTRRGSKTGDAAPAAADAPAVARLREQGAIFLGKTCLPEHGWIGVCHSPLTGITRNPWNPDHTPGGSTGGGAVAALLGLGAAASRHRWRRLAAHSRRLYRRVRHEAELRPGADLSAVGAQCAGASGADHAHASPMPR